MSFNSSESKSAPGVPSAAQWRSRIEEVKSRLARLTPRERQVLDLIVAGLSNKQIAAALGVSSRTIEVHRARVMRKMEAQTPIELACGVQCSRCEYFGGRC